jgi:phage baseplate assembly protein W
MDLNHETGAAVEGWDHVVQSIQTILTTRLNSRVFRREFGSEVPALVDAPMNDANVLALYVAVAPMRTKAIWRLWWMTLKPSALFAIGWKTGDL